MAIAAEVFLSLDAQQLELARLKEDVASCHRETAAISMAISEALTELPAHFLARLRWHGGIASADACTDPGKLLKSEQHADVTSGNPTSQSEIESALIGGHEISRDGAAAGPRFGAGSEEGGTAAAERGGSHIYVCGGFDGISWMNSMERYCTSTGCWEVLPPMSEQRSGAAAAILGRRLYVCGGRNGPELLSQVECFDPHNADGQGIWEAAPSMLSAREGATASVLNGLLYVCGGLDEDGMQLNSVEMLNVDCSVAHQRGEWQALPPMLERRAWAVAGVLGSLIYICGGEGEHKRSLNSVEHSAGSSWQLGPPMLQPRTEAAGAALAGQLIICGGCVSTPASRSGERFDSAIGIWEVLPLLTVGRDLPAAAALDKLGKLYIFGGGSSNEILCSAACFDSRVGEWTELPALSQRRWGAVAAASPDL